MCSATQLAKSKRVTDHATMRTIDRQRRAGSLFLIACGIYLSACNTPGHRHAKSFVRWDAASDAMSSAQERCGGSAYLKAHRRGYSPDDYSCEPNQRRRMVASGGTRMMFVPQKNGSVSAVPVNTGLPSRRAAEAVGAPIGWVVLAVPSEPNLMKGKLIVGEGKPSRDGPFPDAAGLARSLHECGQHRYEIINEDVHGEIVIYPRGRRDRSLIRCVAKLMPTDFSADYVSDRTFSNESQRKPLDGI
jgi:hypothetical protein